MKRLIWAALALVSASPLFAAAPLTDFVAAVNNLKLAPEVANVSNTTFTVGHITVKMASGSAARVLAGSEPVGIYFKGNGTFDYETVEAAEIPVVDHNVKAVAHLKMTADANHAVLSGDFADLLILAGGVEMPALNGSGGAPLADAFAQHRALYDRLRVPPPSHPLAVQKFSFPSQKLVWAEFSGGRDNYAYAYDDVDDHDESLYTVAGPKSYTDDKRIQQWLFLNLLSAQFIGHDHWTAARPPFTLNNVDYTFTGDGSSVVAEVTETISRSTSTQNVLRFNMNSITLYRPNEPFAKYNVRAVTDEQGKPLAFDHDKEDLVVALNGAAGPTVKLKFSIDGDFLIREGGDNAWQLGLGDAWFPLPRQLSAQAYTVHSVIKVKKPFVAIAPGNTVARREEGDFNVVENIIDKPVQFTMIQAGKYTISEQKEGERTVRVATYGLPNARASKQLTDLAFGLIDYYEVFLGPFPWKEFNIIQVNTYGYGQAPPGTMFITNEAFNPTQSEVDQIFSQGINERFAHEIAHQYWAYVVRMPSNEEQWLTETFAEYSAALAIRKLRGEQYYNRLVSVWKGEASMGSKIAPIPYANRIGGDPRTAFRQRNALLYAKGPLLLWAIHKEIGDTAFLTFLKSYTKTFNFKAGTTKDVAGLLSFMTKKDWKPFFDQYFWGMATPQ